MGREAASAFARWFALENFPVRVELTAVCDLQPALLEWFRAIPSVRLLTADHRALLASADVDVGEITTFSARMNWGATSNTRRDCPGPITPKMLGSSANSWATAR